MKELAHGLFGEFWRWPESRSVQQLVCCLALNALDVSARMRLAMPRFYCQNREMHAQDLVDATTIHRISWKLSESVGDSGASMSSGLRRSLARGVEVLKAQIPGETPLDKVKPGEWRAMHSAADYILLDVMGTCPLWTRKAPRLWQELADHSRALWERHNQHAKAEERGEDIRFMIKSRAGYYTN